MREECPISDLWVSVKCGESDTTSGLGSNPTVGNLIDKLDPLGITRCFGEPSEITGAADVCKLRGNTPEAGQKFFATWNAYMDEVTAPHKSSHLPESNPTHSQVEAGATPPNSDARGRSVSRR